MTARAVRRVVHLDTGREWRGGQAQVFLLMQGLAQRGIESLLLAPPGPLLDRARKTGLECEVWRARGDWDVPAAWAAYSTMRRFVPDVAHAHSARAHALGVPAARLARVPAVVVSRRVAIPLRRGLGGLKYRMPVERYLCVSRGVIEAMERGGVPRERLLLVPSGIEMAPHASDDLRRTLGLAPETPLVVTAAALTKEKRHLDLLDALPRVLAAIPDAHLVWLGEGDMRPTLEERRDRLGLTERVHLLGFRQDARALVAQCTIAALASEMEGIATTLIEAQAAGIPVVATAVGGVPEVVSDGVTGRLVPPRSPQSLADALVELLSDPARRVAMGAAAREAAARFHIDRTVELTLDAYRMALGENISAA